MSCLFDGGCSDWKRTSKQCVKARQGKARQGKGTNQQSRFRACIGASGLLATFLDESGLAYIRDVLIRRDE